MTIEQTLRMSLKREVMVLLVVAGIESSSTTSNLTNTCSDASILNIKATQ